MVELQTCFCGCNKLTPLCFFRWTWWTQHVIIDIWRIGVQIGGRSVVLFHSMTDSSYVSVLDLFFWYFKLKQSLKYRSTIRHVINFLGSCPENWRCPCYQCWKKIRFGLLETMRCTAYPVSQPAAQGWETHQSLDSHSLREVRSCLVSKVEKSSPWPVVGIGLYACKYCLKSHESWIESNGNPSI